MVFVHDLKRHAQYPFSKCLTYSSKSVCDFSMFSATFCCLISEKTDSIIGHTVDGSEIPNNHLGWW